MKQAETGLLLSIDKVKDKLLKKKDDLSLWVKYNPKIFRNTDDLTLQKLSFVSSWIDNQ